MHLIMEGTEVKDRHAMANRLTGPFRTMGDKFKPDEVAAPSWWHGEEEAYESSMAAMMRLPQRGRGRA
jgi:hypothetical protein